MVLELTCNIIYIGSIIILSPLIRSIILKLLNKNLTLSPCEYYKQKYCSFLYKLNYFAESVKLEEHIPKSGSNGYIHEKCGATEKQAVTIFLIKNVIIIIKYFRKATLDLISRR